MYNPNPCGRAVGDCAVRAVSLALGLDWEKAYLLLVSAAFAMCDMPSSNSVHGAVLREHGFVRENLNEPITFGKFAKEHNRGTYVLGTGTHLATIINGVLYDAWNSSNELAEYVWYRKDD